LGFLKEQPLDNISKEKRSKIMRAIKSGNTRPELCVRRIAFSLGYRYRTCDTRLPGRPDLVFRSRKKVIFVHGCFWHVHERCPISHIPKYSLWRQKLLANRKRDRNVLNALQREGWRCLVIWECELTALDNVQKRIVEFLG
jgi:DNA mismatch endonuclease, patch repair protein